MQLAQRLRNTFTWLYGYPKAGLEDALQEWSIHSRVTWLWDIPWAALMQTYCWIKELVEDKAGAEAGVARSCDVTGVLLGFTSSHKLVTFFMLVGSLDSSSCSLPTDVAQHGHQAFSFRPRGANRMLDTHAKLLTPLTISEPAGSRVGNEGPCIRY